VKGLERAKKVRAKKRAEKPESVEAPDLLNTCEGCGLHYDDCICVGTGNPFPPPPCAKCEKANGHLHAPNGNIRHCDCAYGQSLPPYPTCPVCGDRSSTAYYGACYACWKAGKAPRMNGVCY
jgi:hypothetical protein